MQITPSSVINSLDLMPIVKHMSGPVDQFTGLYGWSIDFCLRLSEQYRRFWYLMLKYPEEVIIPFRELDEFWHVHILDTQKYSSDCNLVFGKFIHHFPYRQDGKYKEIAYKDLYDRTLDLMKLEFPEAIDGRNF